MIIPNRVTNIEHGVFYDCTSLASITLPEGVTEIRSAAFHTCSSLASVKLPNGLTAIKGRAFEDCTSLVSVIIPETVSTIGVGAFRGSGLISVVLPRSCSKIHDRAFAYCRYLSLVVAQPGIKAALYNPDELTFDTLADISNGFKNCPLLPRPEYTTPRTLAALLKVERLSYFTIPQKIDGKYIYLDSPRKLQWIRFVMTALYARKEIPRTVVVMIINMLKRHEI